MPTFNHIKHMIKKSYKFLSSLLFIAALLLVFASNINAAQAASSLKIKDLKFDNSDNLILIESDGVINLKKTAETIETSAPEEKIINHNEIKKGFLKEPNRAYVDIFNATVEGGATKNYELKNSIFKTVRMSQFQTNPNIVRIVFTYANENTPNGNFNCIANDKGIVIRYSNSLNKTSNYQIIYSNTNDEDRTVFFQNTTASIAAPDTIVPVSNVQDNKAELNKMFEKNNEKIAQEKEYKLQSKFYIETIAQNPNGITIKGTGFLSLKPAIFLDNPNRMVIDFDDTVLARNLRNRTFTIGAPEIDSEGTLKPKEIVRLGQNSTNVARLVIQGNDAKNYRAVISPDLQNIYIAKRSDVINSKITETQSTIKSINITDETINEKENEENKKEKIISSTIEFNLTEPVAFSVFEENKNLYIDFNNVSSISENILNELLKYDKNIKNIKIALDKLRIVFPLDENVLNIQVKSTPNAKSLQAVIKKKEAPKEENKEDEATISKAKKKEPSISNLYKVVIDAGHGGTDVGATRVGIYEKNITLAIAKMVEKNLQNKNVQTTMTLDRDKTVSLQEGCDISNETSPDVFVSIHVNSSVNDAIYGVETHWWKQDSVEYAKIVHSHLEKNFNKWKTKDRGLFKSQFYVINHTEAPAILVEIGFISNADEREAIITQKRQSEIAKAITDGVMEYLKTRGKEKE